jgi:hypothetical protein
MQEKAFYFILVELISSGMLVKPRFYLLLFVIIWTYLLGRRFQIRGAMHVVFYSLPEYPHFYSEIVNMLREAEVGGLQNEISSISLFTKYEQMALERIVGREKCAYMLSSKKSTFIFK